MNFLARRFKFGYFEVEDIKQEAFLLAVEALDRWDRVRPLHSFLYAHIHNRLCNLKRKLYERRSPPCHSCPLKAFIRGECTRYAHPSECSYYIDWECRNSVKKGLMYPGEIKDRLHGKGKPGRMETEEIFLKIWQVIPQDIKERFLTGKKLRKVDIETIQNLYRGPYGD